MTHEIALDKVTMTYSWHNISDQYQNNQIKYSPDGGTSWETVKFVDGMYTYSVTRGAFPTGSRTVNDSARDNWSLTLEFLLALMGARYG